MSKRPHDGESEEEKIRRKLRRYEKKLSRLSNVNSETNNEDSQIYQEQHQPSQHVENDTPNQEIIPPVPPEAECDEIGYTETQVNDYTEDSSSSDGSAVPESLEKERVPDLPTVDPKLLEALGDCYSDTPEWGDDIFEEISQRWEPIFKLGLKKELKEELYKKHLFPKNLPSSKPPVLNPEISAVLTEACRNRDSRVMSKQGQLGRALAALGRAMTGLITNSMETSEIIKTLNDAGRLISDSHFMETDTRRSLITPLLDKSYIAPFKDRKRDHLLFGENLGEFIKSSRGIKKTGQLITPPPPPPVPSTSGLNYRGPQRQQRNVRAQPSRGGGAQRQPPPAPRRAAPQPPPAYAPRRAPPALGSGSRRAPHATSSRPRNTS